MSTAASSPCTSAGWRRSCASGQRRCDVLQVVEERTVAVTVVNDHVDHATGHDEQDRDHGQYRDRTPVVQVVPHVDSLHGSVTKTARRCSVGFALGEIESHDVRPLSQRHDDGIRAVARIAAEVNGQIENIGARRLQTVMEKLLEDVSFEAEDRRGETLTVDSAFVDQQLAGIARDADLSRYVL